MDLVTTRVPDRKDSKVSRLRELAVVDARSSLCRLAWSRLGQWLHAMLTLGGLGVEEAGDW
ncbi:hypothetical protein KTAU_01230 [Thermogemmatispora aurantia]|uniref:Uncharacterized protein n=1 Tax=Thermogemmatispora aurantia TaxID=2045279 RepID=A0A5J4JUT4_9CHLR|nr:hypothetical protein KTAU_01230 [Thermogemmatispora aurantia]